MSHSLSIVLPVFNEEGNIHPLFEEIKNVMTRLGNTWEIIYVDDASTDFSTKKIRELMQDNANIQLLEFVKNCGQSAAFCAGFAAAKHELIITMDADMQNDPADIPKMLELFDQGNDMVIGWRHKRKDTSSKRLASKIGNAFRKALTKDSVHDTGCSLKIMRASMAKKLPLQFKGMHRFLVSLMQMENAKVAEIPVNHRDRFSGISKYNTWARGIAASQDLLVVNWFFRRIKKFELKSEQITHQSRPATGTLSCSCNSSAEQIQESMPKSDNTESGNKA